MTNHNFVWLVKHAVSYSHEVTPGKPKPSLGRITRQPEETYSSCCHSQRVYSCPPPPHRKPLNLITQTKSNIDAAKEGAFSEAGSRSSDKEEDGGAFKYWLDPTMGLWLTSMQQQGDTKNPKQSTAQFKLFKNEK